MEQEELSDVLPVSGTCSNRMAASAMKSVMRGRVELGFWPGPPKLPGGEWRWEVDLATCGVDGHHPLVWLATLQ